MPRKNPVFLILILVLLHGEAIEASCRVEGRDPSAVSRLRDPLGLLLASSEKCPADVFELRERLSAEGWKLEATMVANRGFHNSKLGNFSVFERASERASQSASGGESEIFFGHFTRPGANQELVADQDPRRGSLLVEAIAWDPGKLYYNFYELIGSGLQGQWFYRGDSADILADNQLLHRQPDPSKPAFGNRLRCSACHLAGGPIMKELAAPHNDWWTKERGLEFGGRVPDQKLSKILQSLVPAERLAENVNLGLKKLFSSVGFQRVQKSLSLQERLRPLFCSVEVNFQSDRASHSEGNLFIEVPVEFLVDSRWLPPATEARPGEELWIRREDYLQALQSMGSLFPETEMLDADHAWLTPVKAKSDQFAIDTLIEKGVIDEEFVADVLALDFMNPVFSQARCSLLKFLPNAEFSGWKQEFLERLEHERSEAAQELFRNLIHPSRNRVAYQARILDFLGRCGASLLDPKNAVDWVQLLDQKRQEIRSSEISKNPRGQILEPGFRVIFPKIRRSVPPRQLNISQDCGMRPA